MDSIPELMGDYEVTLLLGTYQPASITRWDIFLMAFECCKFHQTVMFFFDQSAPSLDKATFMFIPALNGHALG